MSGLVPAVSAGPWTKRFAVVGLGKNGLPVALGLRSMGADVVAWDDNPAARQAAVDAMAGPGDRGAPVSPGILTWSDPVVKVRHPLDKLIQTRCYQYNERQRR